MKILVAGRSGQLARALASRRWPEGTQCVALGRPDLDVTDEASVAAVIDAQAPDVIVNAAAYTAVERAESERDAAFALNEVAPRCLAREAARRGITLIHVSTDYVFGGAGSRPWREDEPVAPQGVYALSKFDGEEAVRAECARHVIVRTSWLFAAHGQNFVRAMLRLGASDVPVRVVDDQWGCPTPAAELAEAVATVAAAKRAVRHLPHLRRGRGDVARLRGRDFRARGPASETGADLDRAIRRRRAASGLFGAGCGQDLARLFGHRADGLGSRAWRRCCARSRAGHDQEGHHPGGRSGHAASAPSRAR